ncbi:MAG TPA: hypothetical protein PLE99_17850 [Candidatus Thiothrix moscowensis]|uniref:DUF6364 family protein n=1 Tax=unclassified Thiothrix TaxID=2636184 RepID=UPI001A287D5E|nr:MULTISPECIES: DUF6364 family protein [unclassified Thiothrix]MBJ6611432.1 hypothetical protein [Candidatus Thiothrix moscowensis]HRJ54630.1 hypothetical protein [Candidatus Thiothrix moscowensis]HRJ95031.1 hypothetical protein [Candidatus Thiothrix moscowensis]
MSNLTISIDETILKKARMRALEDGTSVNALLRDYLERYVNSGQPYQQATQTLLAIAKRSTAASQGRRWARDELYER